MILYVPSECLSLHSIGWSGFVGPLNPLYNLVILLGSSTSLCANAGIWLTIITQSNGLIQYVLFFSM